MYLTFRIKEDHAEKVFRKHIDKLFHKDRETRRKDKWEKTKNFFFDFNNFFSILDAGIYNKYAINVPAKNGDIIPTNFPIAFPIAVKLSRNL